jgi:hypothetical protein
LAAVPVATHKAATSRSNRSEKAPAQPLAERVAVIGRVEPVAAAIAASTSGQTAAALSEKKRMAPPKAVPRRWNTARHLTKL